MKGGILMEYFEIHRIVTDTGIVSMVKCKDRDDAIKKYKNKFPEHNIKSCKETNKHEIEEYSNAGGIVLN